MWFKRYEHFHKLTTTGRTDAQQTLVHQKSGFAYQWLGIGDMHMYPKCDQNTPCGSRVMSLYTNWYNRRDYSADPRVVQLAN